jgi:hypothetical protein
MIRKDKITQSELLERVRGLFEKFSDHRGKNSTYKLSDALMSGLAMFFLNIPLYIVLNNRRKRSAITFNTYSG